MSVPVIENLGSTNLNPWLVTGGSGYIGGHVIRNLLDTGIETVNLDIDYESGLLKFQDEILNETCDIRDISALNQIFRKYSFAGVIHLAALKSVEDSLRMQEEYYEINVEGTRNILNLMSQFGVRKFIFSSSAAVYEAQQGESLVNENSPVNPLSFYGQTKLNCENIIQEFSNSNKITALIFRYFNVAGSANVKLKDKSVQNLIPITIDRIRSGQSPEIFGNDYETPDGTAIRDYVDVRDIAIAHLQAIRYLSNDSRSSILNLGTGQGASVKEVISLTQNIMGTNLPISIKSRRAGDISAIAADCRNANETLGFKAKYSLREMIETSI